MDLKEYISNIINKLEHKRFKNFEEIRTTIALQIDGIFKFQLIDGSENIVCDNYLIGTIGIVKNDNGFIKKFYYEFQLYYIKDNLENYYITKSELLEESFNYLSF